MGHAKISEAQARVVAIRKGVYLPTVLLTMLVFPKILRYPGMLCALATTFDQPPATLMPKNTITISEKVITMLWIRLVTDAAMNPPSAQ